MYSLEYRGASISWQTAGPGLPDIAVTHHRYSVFSMKTSDYMTVDVTLWDDECPDSEVTSILASNHESMVNMLRIRSMLMEQRDFALVPLSERESGQIRRILEAKFPGDGSGTVREIGKILGMSEESTVEWLAATGRKAAPRNNAKPAIPRPGYVTGKKGYWTPEEETELIERRKRKQTIRVIADVMGRDQVSVKTKLNALSRRGVI